jgi:hypothetical protein
LVLCDLACECAGLAIQYCPAEFHVALNGFAIGPEAVDAQGFRCALSLLVVAQSREFNPA